MSWRIRRLLRLIYNGVVYNEMKGAFSSPESVLDSVITERRCSRTPAMAMNPAEIRRYIPDSDLRAIP